MDLTVQNVFGLLLRSRLLTLEEARGALDRFNREAGPRAGDTPTFLAFLAAAGLVTEYQAGLLSQGYADGFFIHQYRVLDRLGKGRMAGVFKAQHPTGPVVAVKVLPPSRARDASLLARFQREARLAIKLKHPNVVRTYHVGEWKQEGRDPLHYLVMEHLEGETLEDLVTRRKQLPPHEAVPLVYQVLMGLHHIHAVNLVHRDLKPSNLMVLPGPGGEGARALVKILDLGLGRALFDENAPAPPEEDAGLTAEGVLLGTPDYMAPEQARDPRGVDIRSDIYSVGCVLYHLLAGQPPFPDTNIMSQMIRHATEEPRPVREFNAAVPDGLQQILNWMMAKDPAKRYPTPERAAQALQIFLGAGFGDMEATIDDPSMTQYLTWLELDNPDAPPPSSEKRPPAKSARDAAATIPSPPPPKAPPRPPKAKEMARLAPKKKEGTDKQPVFGAPVPAAAPPAPLPVPAPPALTTANSDRAAEAARKKGKVERPSPPGTARAVPVAAPAFDVDLVALPTPGEDLPLFSFPLQRRDFVMFGIGVVTATVGLGLGGLVSLALREKSTPPPPPPEE